MQYGDSTDRREKRYGDNTNRREKRYGDNTNRRETVTPDAGKTEYLFNSTVRKFNSFNN